MVDLGPGHLSGLTETAEAWEAAWAPYDAATYQAALAFLRPEDVVLDIGAGDLRFARRAAARARRVIAIEQRGNLLSGSRPPNLQVIHGDARRVEFPRGITVGVLLMRHCRHFADYVGRLRDAGCTRLITNARWGMDVESMPIGRQTDYASAAPGWYACQCGAVGFKPCLPDRLSPAVLARRTEVANCPACDWTLQHPGA